MEFLQKYHPSWKPFLTDEIIEMLKNIESNIDVSNINPNKDKVLCFLQNNLDNVKAVILGQDPYPEKGVATGKSFQIYGLNDWTQKFRQTSFRNILRLLYKNYNGIDKYSEIPKFKDIVSKIEVGEFKILPPFELLDRWEEQGVLLLNASFTCTPSKPNSHKDLWIPFTIKLIEFLSNYNKNIHWILWGKFAENFSEYIKEGHLYLSRHPMMCSEKYENDFLKSDCFKDLINDISWLG